MNQHSPISKSDGTAPRSTPRPAAPALPKLQTIVKTARQAGNAVGKTASKAGQVVGKTSQRAAASIKQEEPQTIAKMALAAVTPQLVNAALRFAIRNPVTAVLGIAVVAVVMASRDDAETAAA